jgi:hypothetical protein
MPGVNPLSTPAVAKSPKDKLELLIVSGRFGVRQINVAMTVRKTVITQAGKAKNSFCKNLCVLCDLDVNSESPPTQLTEVRYESRGRASSISRFISRTASPRPQNSALATMACPMLSSRTSGIAAMAFTLW